MRSLDCYQHPGRIPNPTEMPPVGAEAVRFLDPCVGALPQATKNETPCCCLEGKTCFRSLSSNTWLQFVLSSQWYA
jgi:hypothetical protein